MKNQKEQIKTIETIVNTNHFVCDRVSKLRKLGFEVKQLPMGCGGVLQKKKMNNGELRIQIGYGHGRYNYAMTLKL